jgi:hypothetical protein
MKHLLIKVGKDVSGVDFRLALLAWRSTPRADGFSPAFAFHGRHLRTLLPDVRQAAVPAVGPAFAAARELGAGKAADLAGGRLLAPLPVGAMVHYKKKDDTGIWHTGATVLQVLSGRSYVVQTPDGDFRKNRRHLRLAVLGPLVQEPVAAAALPVAVLPGAVLPAVIPGPNLPAVIPGPVLPGPVLPVLLPAWLGAREAATPGAVRRSRRNRHVSFQ